MKVLLGTRALDSTWFLPGRSQSEIKLMLDGLNADSMIGVTLEQGKSFKKSPIFEIMKKRMDAVAYVSSEFDCDLVQTSDVTFPDLVDSQAFEEFREKRTGQPFAGEEPEELYSRKLAKVVSLSTHIHLIDKHFLKNLVGEGTGATFLLRHFLNDSKAKIFIHCASLNVEADLITAKSNLEKLTTQANRKGSVEVIAYKEVYGRQFQHDRIGRLIPQWGAIGFTMGHGSELFGRKQLEHDGILTDVKVAFSSTVENLRKVDKEPTTFKA